MNDDIISITDDGRIESKHIYTIKADIYGIQKLIDSGQKQEAVKIISDKITDFFAKKILS